jgi:hypothetical protein
LAVNGRAAHDCQGSIRDGKTTMLLQHAALVGLETLRNEGSETQR